MASLIKSLWVVPHQDDEVLSMGMAILSNAHKGNKNFILDVCDGSSSSALDILNGLEVCTCSVCPIGQLKGMHNPLNENFIDGYLDRTELSLARDREQESAISILKAQLYKRLRYPDGSANLHISDISDEIITWINNNGGDIAVKKGLVNVRVTSFKDSHSDHVACAKAVSNVEKLYSSRRLKLDIQYYLSPLIWNHNGISIYNKSCVQTLRHALNAYKIYEPIIGRYQIGWHSTESLFQQVYNDPRSKYHV